MTWGSEEDRNKKKVLVLVFYLLVFAFLTWQLIDVVQKKGTIMNNLLFYMVFFFVLGITPLIIDIFVKDKEWPIEAISIENNALIKLSVPKQLLFSGILAVLLMIWISTSQTAFVQAPTFQLLDTKFGGALVSGIVGGVCETAVIFAFLTPTIGNMLGRDNNFLCYLFGVIAGTAIFLLFHTIVYAYDQVALFSVAIFGFINVVLLLVFRSVIPLIAIHFINNFTIVLFSVGQIMVLL